LKVKFLGVHNAESKESRLPSLLIDDILAIDAGSLTSELSFSEQEKIKAILLSHGHYDHIRGVPAFAFNNPTKTTRVFGTSKTLEILSSHLIDGVIYPKFAEKTSFLENLSLELITIESLKPLNIEGYRVLPLPVNHTICTVGFEITKNGRKLFYSGDTGPGLSSVWERISPHLVIMDVSFPNRFRETADDAAHLCPEMLKEELEIFYKMKGYFPQVILVHLNPRLEEEIRSEIKELNKELDLSITVAREGDKIVV
jgi:ribonuclease BN (tRNA processing enzyme)